MHKLRLQDFMYLNVGMASVFIATEAQLDHALKICNALKGKQSGAYISQGLKEDSVKVYPQN